MIAFIILKKAVFNWSGGKDSSICLHKVLLENKFTVTHLLTSINSEYQRISMHGVRVELLELQAQSIGIPLIKMMMPEMPSMEIYEGVVREKMNELKSQGVNNSIFGDIFLEDLKKYRIDKLSQLQINAIFPIWKIPTPKLIREFIDLGFKAVIVCIDESKLDKSFVGRDIDDSFIKDLPGIVDPCGENGEFHSFVYDGPIFSFPIGIKKGEIIRREYKKPASGPNSAENTETSGFWYCDLLPIR